VWGIALRAEPVIASAAMMASVNQLEEHRRSMTGYCYRMLGSAVDADDAVQEAMVRAWRSLDRFDGRSSLRTWLHRIATNVCLDAIDDRTRRVRPVEEGEVGTTEDCLETRERKHWIEPIPDARALPETSDPAERIALRQSIRLAFVAALQRLPAKQRAALLLTDVLGLSASETAESLDMSVASVNSALQRARATMKQHLPRHRLDWAPSDTSREERELLQRYVEAADAGDPAALIAVLWEDAFCAMPPSPQWWLGRENIVGAWVEGWAVPPVVDAEQAPSVRAITASSAKASLRPNMVGTS